MISCLHTYMILNRKKVSFLQLCFLSGGEVLRRMINSIIVLIVNDICFS